MTDFDDQDEKQTGIKENEEIERIVLTEELDKMEEKTKELEMLEKKKKIKQY